MNILIIVGIRILEGMFVLGLVFASLVLVLATAEDVALMFEKDTPEIPPGQIDAGGPGS